jgi:Serine aminopeptidase, S33
MSIFKILKQPFFGQFMVKWRSPLSPEQQSEWQKHEISSKSGATLQALYAKSNTEKAKATIVLAHPMGKEAKGYFIKYGYTDLLRQNGYNVFVFDINGFGESTIGNFSFFEDIIAACKKAKSLTPHLPLGYHGISLGGQMSTIAFTDPAHSVDFAIIESAATTLEEFWIMFPTAYKTLKLLYLFVPNYKRKIRMIDRIKEIKNLQSILFIYSNTDDWTPTSMGQRFHENCPVPSTLWTVPEAKHAMITKSDYKIQYQQKILDYFQSSIPS